MAPSRPRPTFWPLRIAPDRGPRGTLIGHVARANPWWRDLEDSREVLVICQGPRAGSPPAGCVEPNHVLTWNQVTVQADGGPRLVPEAAGRPRIGRGMIGSTRVMARTPGDCSGRIVRLGT